MAADVLGCLIVADALEGDDKCVPDQSELPENRDYVSLTVHIDRTEGQVLPGVLDSKDSKVLYRHDTCLVTLVYLLRRHVLVYLLHTMSLAFM